MKSSSDAQQSYGPLGKKVEPIPVPEVDEFEHFKGAHGTPMIRNKRTGAIETDMTPKGPQFPPNPWQTLIDAMKKQAQEQEEDGFPIHCWGFM